MYKGKTIQVDLLNILQKELPNVDIKGTSLTRAEKILKLINFPTDRILLGRLLENYTALTAQDCTPKPIRSTKTNLVIFGGATVCSLATIAAFLAFWPVVLVVWWILILCFGISCIDDRIRCSQCAMPGILKGKQANTPTICAKCLSKELQGLDEGSLPIEIKVAALERIVHFVDGSYDNIAKKSVYSAGT